MPYILEPPLPLLPLEHSSTMSQTMLLTKRLTTFLSQNTTPQLPTLLLLSPTGKLLSSSSPSPASTLRTQANLACSLWTLYQPTTSILPSALPSHHPSSSQGHNGGGGGNSRGLDATFSSTSTITDHDLSTITIQLTQGIMVIRALSCGLLFVAIGPSNNPSATSAPQQTLQAQAHANSSRHTSPPSSPPAQSESHDGEGHGQNQNQSQSQVQSPAPNQREFGNHLAVGSAAPSDTGSIRSTATRGGSIASIKRQAVEVGRWLDAQLEGFQLCPPEAR